jgi:hypothetical protein
MKEPYRKLGAADLLWQTVLGWPRPDEETPPLFQTHHPAGMEIGASLFTINSIARYAYSIKARGSRYSKNISSTLDLADIFSQRYPSTYQPPLHVARKPRVMKTHELFHPKPKRRHSTQAIVLV